MKRAIAPVNLFVYGTLKPGGRYHGAYCGDFLLGAVPAIAPGTLYHLPHPHNYPAMTEGPGWVQGYLLSFSSDAVLQRLDQLEDYHPQRPPEQNLYDRCRMEVHSPQSQASLGEAWAYRMAEGTVHRFHGIRVEDGNWLAD